MTDSGFKGASGLRLPGGDVATAAARLCGEVKHRLPPGTWLDFAAHVLAWAVAEQGRRSDFRTLRVYLNEVLGPAVASGLDVAYQFDGHGCKVDIDPPMGRRTP